MRPARVFFTFGCYHASPEIPIPYIFPTGINEIASRHEHSTAKW